MADHILTFLDDYVFPAVVMAGCTALFVLGTLKAWELFLVDAPICL